MTSKISFSKLTMDELRKSSWMIAVQFLAFGILIPLRVLMVLAAHASDILKYGEEPQFLKYFCWNAGLELPETTLAIILAGTFCAFCTFSYIHSLVKLDFYHSLPLKRERLFAVKYLSSVLTFVIPYVICQGLAVLIGVFYGAVLGEVIAELVMATAIGILSFLCGYAGTLLAMMLTGKLLTSLFAVIVLVAYVPVLLIIWNGFESLFLPTLLNSGELSSDILVCSSPWAFAMYQNNLGVSDTVGKTGPIPTMADYCQLIAVAVLCSLAALALYRVRRTEAAGSALAFRKTEGLIKMMLSVPAALTTALIASEILDNLAMELLFLVLFGILACMIMEFIYRWDIRQLFAKKRHMVITAAAAVLIFLPFRLELTGVNTWIPEKEELVSMAMQTSSQHYSYDLEGVEFSREGRKKSLDHAETENFDLIYELAKNGISHVGTDDYYEDVIYIYIKYHLKNGREVYRTYYADTEAVLDVLDSFMADDEYRERYFPICTWTREDTDKLEGKVWMPEEAVRSLMGVDADPEDLALSKSFTDEELWQLVQTYQKEMQDATYRDMWTATINFYFCTKETYWTIGDFNIPESFTETIGVLKEIWNE